MNLRSSTFLRQQLELLRVSQREHPAARPADRDSLYDDVLAGVGRRIAELERELELLESREEPVLEVAFSGTGVYDHSMTFRRLEAVVPPLGQTLRWTARDVATLSGDEVSTDADLNSLAEPVLAGAFDGSFGLTISRSPVSEQLSLLNGPLFDRTAGRFMDVFRTARDSREPAEIVRSMAGLGRNAISGFRKLSLALTTTTEPTRMRWRNEELVAVSSPIAATVVEALSSVRTDEYDVPVVGTFVGGDLPDERFHIQALDDDGKPVHYRGNVVPTMLAKIRGIPLGARVRAIVQVTEMESEYLATSRRTRVLTSIDLVEGTGE